MKEGYPAFDMEYKQTLKKYAGSNVIVPQEILPQNVFNVSFVPWLHFEHFSSNTSNGDNKIIKMITLGKYAEINGRFLPRLQYRYLMPLLTVIIYCCFLTDCRKN